MISIMITIASNTLDTCQQVPSAESLLPHARVVEWQTRTFEGRMPKGLRVQVPPRAFLFHLAKMSGFMAAQSHCLGQM